MKVIHCTCIICGRRYEYERGGDKGYDTKLCSSMCDGIHAGRARAREALIETLNTLQRYDEKINNYYTSIDRDQWGDFVRVDDIARAFGLSLDEYNEETDLSCGFSELNP